MLPTPVHLSILTRPPWLFKWAGEVLKGVVRGGPARATIRWSGLGQGTDADTWENLDWGGHPDSTDLMWGKGAGREIKQD